MSEPSSNHATTAGALLPWLLGAAALTLGALWAAPDLHMGVAWLGAISVSTFLLFGWDKLCARREVRRVPEAALLTASLLGGSLGALVGMNMFQHKTSKASFRWKFWALALVQVLGFLAWLKYRDGSVI